MIVITSLISILVIGAFLKNTIHDRKRIDGYILENQRLRDELWELNTGHKVRLPYQKHELKEINLSARTEGTLITGEADRRLKNKLAKEFIKAVDIESETLYRYDSDIPEEHTATVTFYVEVYNG